MDNEWLEKLLRKARVRGEIDAKRQELIRQQKDILAMKVTQAEIFAEIETLQMESQELAEWLDQRQYENEKQQDT